MRSSFLSRRALLALLPVLLSIAAAAQDWSAPARELAEKIVARVQARSAVTVSLRNLSSLTQNDAAQVRRALETELRTRGVQLVGADRAVDEVRLTLSENAVAYLWVAEIGHGDTWEVVMTQTPLPAVPQRGGTGVSIRRSLVWSQPEPMLDFATADLSGGSLLLVLEPDRLVLYRLAAGRWTRESTARIAHSQPLPRDVRGRLLLQRDGSFTAHLPGAHCEGNTQPQLMANCIESDDPWPLGASADGQRAVFNSSRHYFTGALVPGFGALAKLPPFYSAAALRDSAATVWLFSLVDGSTRLVGGGGETVGVVAGWGSDLAGIRSDCAQDSLLLTTRTGDSTRPDAVQAYGMAAGEPQEAGPSAEFAGPLLSLWTSGEGAAVTAISRNLRTKQYEAFTFTVVCGH
ncbi:MAG TPA: hypothetical protein VMS96_07945 [Terriglobales bacterium]|nr:hypothetical protein [Terriglobales bacterium]